MTWEPRSWPARHVLLAILGIAIVTACSRTDSGQASETADEAAAVSSAPSSPEAAVPAAADAPLSLTAADLDGFEKGLRREIELVRAAQERAGKATTPAE